MLFVFCATAFCACSRAQPDGFQITKDVCYETVGGTNLRMDLLRSSLATGALPLVILIHGGGWAAGDKSSMEAFALGLAKAGFATASVDYRLAPANKFPAALIDVKTALQYILQHAKELKINPNRIGVVGGSAGAHLALMLATTTADTEAFKSSSEASPCPIKAAVSIAGPTDLTANFSAQGNDILKNFFGKKRDEDLALYKQASPINYVTRFSAPILLIHGDKDELVPYSQSESFLSACKQAGVSANLITIPNGGHGSGGTKADNDASIRAMVEFLVKYLKS
jgi:acetyl esterase/lipase